MEFTSTNPIVKLCLQGMALEAKDQQDEAAALFLQAWNETSNDFEKFIVAHYIARHQKTITDTLQWLETDLQLALKVNNEAVQAAFPPLYTNIAKCYDRAWTTSFRTCRA
jgi:rifampin ADP-ribosylating transferase